MKENYFNTSALSLNDLCDLIIDCEHKTAPIQEAGYPSIRTPNIGRGRLILDNVNRVSDETYQIWTKRAIPQGGDIVLAREAPVGNVAIIPTGIKVCLGQRTVLIRPKRTKVEPHYLLYLLLSNEIQEKLLSRTAGATVAHLNMSDIRRLELPQLPSIQTQRKIASILSAYDDLIENNSRRIQILEEMAQMIYQEWFVNFRFPGHEQVRRVDSEIGEIPEGWEVKKLGEIADINTRSIKKNSEPLEINYIDISSVSTGQIDKIESMLFSEAPSRARRIVKHGDIIWSTVRPNRRSYSIVLNNPYNLVVSTGFAVITARYVPYTYLFHTVTTDEFADYLTSNATGSAYPAVNSNDFKSAAVLVPTITLLNQFHNIIVDIFDQKHILQKKISNLRKTRDLLLPKLISGEIDVEDLDIDIGSSNNDR